MSDEPEYILDRRKLKYRLNKWRFLAILAALIGFASYILVNNEFAAELGVADQIARIDVTGVITDDQARAEMMKQIAASPSVKAVVVRFNSPGGTTTGGEALFMDLRKIASTRPVVAVFGTIATSAAYMSGVAAEHIVARGNSITGSVGVIMQWAEVSDMLEKLGVNMNEIKSGNLKAVPSPFEPLDQPGRELTEEMINESHKWFVDLVVERRNIQPGQIPGFLEGRIYSGRQALEYGLIDAIGGEDQAMAWLHKEKKISAELPVIQWQSEGRSSGGLFGLAEAALSRMLGFDIAENFARYRQSGLVSITDTGGLISKWRQ